MLATKNLEWRDLLYCNAVETNAEFLPVDLKQNGPLGVLQFHMDLVPALSKTEVLHEDNVSK